MLTDMAASFDDLPDPFAGPQELAGDPARQAVDSIRGFLYQIWWSIDAWLRLQSPDEVIFLEGAEDIDKVSAQAATGAQIKSEAAGISLNNQKAHKALENFWAISLRETTRRVDYHYVTTAAVAHEQDAPFGGVAGLEAWRVAQTSLEAAAAIQTYLASKLTAGTALQAFLASAAPQEVQERLIRRVNWFMSQPGLDEVRQSVEDRVVFRLDQTKVPLTYVGAVRDRLHAFACEVIVRKDSARRRLNIADLLREVDTATTSHLPVPALQYQQVQQALQAGAFDPGGALLKLMRMPLPPAPTPLLSRGALVAHVRERMLERKAVLLTGTVYKGKSTLAQLVANEVCPDAWWLPVAGRSNADTDMLLRALAAAVADDGAPPLVVVDNLDLSPAAHAVYGQALALVAGRANRAGRGLLLTARGESSETAQFTDFAGVEPIDVPELSVAEIQQHCSDNSCPDELAPIWATLVRASTQGHPKLVQVRLAELGSAGWPAPTSADLSGVSPAISTARQAARSMLRDSVSDETAAFVYTAAEATFPLTRQMLLSMTSAVGGIANGGDVIDALQGKWLEQVLDGRLSVTPMLRGAATEVWTVERKQLAHSHIYDSIASVRTLDVADAASLLFHAFFAQDGGRLIHCAKLLETIERDDVSAAVFQQLVWLPYISLGENQRFFAPQPAVSAVMRQLQFEVANQVNSESLPAILARWTEEVRAIPDETARSALEVMRCSKLLINRNPRVPLRARFAAITVLGQLSGEAADLAEALTKAFIARTYEQSDAIPLDATSMEFHLAMQALSIRALRDLIAVLDWLEFDSAASDRRAFEDVAQWPLVASCGAFVHGAWASRHESEDDWAPTVEALSRAVSLAQRFGLIGFGSEAAKAKSIVLSEHLGDHAGALQVLDEAALAFGLTPVIREQRVNALFQANDDANALDVWEALVADADAVSSLDAFAYRRAGISACRLQRWSDAERYFLAGATVPALGRLETTSVGLVVDASHVVALAGNPRRAARMLSDVVLTLPDAAREDGDDKWEALLRVATNVCNIIEGAATHGDLTKHALGFAKASEPGLSFGPSQPGQELRTQLVLVRAGLLAAQLGDVSGSYAAVLEGTLASRYPLVRMFSSQAALAYEFNGGAGAGVVAHLRAFELAFNTMASFDDRKQGLSDDGGDTTPTVSMLRNEGWFAVFAAAAICSDDPRAAVASWHEPAVTAWGTESPAVEALSGISAGLALTPQQSNACVRRRVVRSDAETFGAALNLLTTATLNPMETFHLQVLAVSATVCCSEGQVLQMAFGRAIARRFAAVWQQFTGSPFQFSNPRTSIPVLLGAIASIRQGKGSISFLLRSAAQALRTVVGEVDTRLE